MRRHSTLGYVSPVQFEEAQKARVVSTEPAAAQAEATMGKHIIIDPTDGLPASEAGEWAREKHRLLAQYVDATWGARSKWGPSTYADLYSGPGRQFIDNGDELIDGSPLAAWEASNRHGAPFAQVLIADSRTFAQACEARLRKLGAPVKIAAHSAEEAAIVAAKDAHPDGLHLVFADPYNLKDLPWRVFLPLLKLRRVDLIVHFSQADLTRNLDRYFEENPSPLDEFAPGWRLHVKQSGAVQMRGRFFEHWVGLFHAEGFKLADEVTLVVNAKSAPLYRLALFSRHPLAGKIWNSVADRSSQGKLF
jgi:three-Cys-motif partner protein